MENNPNFFPSVYDVNGSVSNAVGMYSPAASLMYPASVATPNSLDLGRSGFSKSPVDFAAVLQQLMSITSQSLDEAQTR
jgi:hypothetical protein